MAATQCRTQCVRTAAAGSVPLSYTSAHLVNTSINILHFGPFLYIIFTADLPQTNDTLIATFADDAAILTADLDPRRASEKLQNHLNTINRWLHQWKICVNTTKSVQITFTTKRSRCPQVNISNNLIPVKKRGQIPRTLPR
jgi:hypothetical protein